MDKMTHTYSGVFGIAYAKWGRGGLFSVAEEDAVYLPVLDSFGCMLRAPNVLRSLSREPFGSWCA